MYMDNNRSQYPCSYQNQTNQMYPRSSHYCSNVPRRPNKWFTKHTRSSSSTGAVVLIRIPCDNVTMKDILVMGGR